MTDEELRTALEGLFAYDSGSRGSGIHDEALRQRCIAELKSKPCGAYEVVPRLYLSRLVREMWLSEESLAQGYGIEDAVSFITWLEDQMMWGLVL